MVLFSLITALVLNLKIRGRGFLRAVYFFPVLLSPVVVGLIWKWILQRDGLLNAAHHRASAADKILFFVEPGWAMFWAVFVSVWAHMGFYTLILLAGLQAIPADLYEAAEMDATPPGACSGASPCRCLWPNLIVVIVLALIRAVQIFDEVYVLTGGGPGHRDADPRAVHLRDGFANQVQNFGLAAAASVLLGVVLVVLTLLQLAVARRKEAEMAAMSLASLLRRRRDGPAGWHWTDIAAYVYLAARRRADVRPGALARAVVVQDPGRAARISAVAAAVRSRPRSTVPGSAKPLPLFTRDHARRHACASWPGPARRHRSPRWSIPPTRAQQFRVADRQARSRCASVALATANYTEPLQRFDFLRYLVQFGVRHGGRDADHAADQLDGRLCALELRVPRQQAATC